VVFRSKAQCEGNGYSLVEHCNTAAGHHRDALRVSLSTPTDCVSPLDKGAAIACEVRLAVNVDKLTELAMITWIEHLPCIDHESARVRLYPAMETPSQGVWPVGLRVMANAGSACMGQGGSRQQGGIKQRDTRAYTLPRVLPGPHIESGRWRDICLLV